MYHPDYKACKSCIYRSEQEACNNLHFEKMPVIARDGIDVKVKCSRFKHAPNLRYEMTHRTTFCRSTGKRIGTCDCLRCTTPAR